MAHWSEKYLSITYDKLNCSKFVEHVIREEFGIDYTFPQSEGSLFNQSKQIRDSVPNYCVRTKFPQDGDLVLMHGRRLMCHVGVYVKIGMSEYVLHTESRLKTAALHKFKEVYLFGFKVEGCYSWVR